MILAGLPDPSLASGLLMPVATLVASCGVLGLPMWSWLRRDPAHIDALLGRLFRLSPEASGLTVLEDGTFIEVTDGLCRLTGYSREDLVGNGTVGLGLWADPAQRDAMRAAMAGTGQVCGMRVRVRCKDGHEVETSFSARIVEVDGRRCVLSSAYPLEAARYAPNDPNRPSLSRSEALIVTSLPDGKVVDVNAGFSRLSGWMRNEAVGHTTIELGLWVDPSDRMTMIAALLGGTGVDQAEYRFRRKDGSVYTGLTSSMRAELGPGHVCAVTSVVDITCHTADDQHLRRHEALERCLAASAARFLAQSNDHLPAAINATLDELGRIVGVDRCQLIRFTADHTSMDCIAEWTRTGIVPLRTNFQGTPLDACPWWRERMLAGTTVAVASVVDAPDATLRGCMAFHDRRAMVDVPLRHAGHTLGVLALSMAGADRVWRANEVGLLELLAGIIASAIARHDAEALIIAREQDLRTILDSIGDAVVVVDAQGRITRLNPVAERLAGGIAGDLLGQPCGTVFPVTDGATGRRRGDLLELAAQGRLVPSGSAVLRTRDGRDVPIQEGGAPLRRADGTMLGLVLVFRDVSDQRQLEEMLRQSHKMDAMGQLAGGVAHDFNNMLAGILGFAELLVAHLAGNDEDERLARRIVRTAERAAGLTRQLLAFSRKGRLLSRNIDLHRVVEDTVSILRRTIDPRIEIATALEAECTIITGDPGLVENALLNLGLNARDAMPEGGRLVLASRNRTLDADDPLLATFGIAAGDYVELSVTDDGTGMTPEVLSKLFMPFFTTKERGKGTGLGLAAVYGILKDHHGAVTAESEVDGGSTFRILFPLAREQTAIETGLFPVRPRLGTGCVLVVDDEPAVRDMATAVLQDLGYEVLQANDGPAGLDAFALHRNRIGLVLLDLVMPRMHGRDVMARLRQIDPAIPILLTSGYAQDANLDELTAQPLVDFLQKPYRIPDLGQRVGELIRET